MKNLMKKFGEENVVQKNFGHKKFGQKNVSQ